MLTFKKVFRSNTTFLKKGRPFSERTNLLCNLRKGAVRVTNGKTLSPTERQRVSHIVWMANKVRTKNGKSKLVSRLASNGRALYIIPTK